MSEESNTPKVPHLKSPETVSDAEVYRGLMAYWLQQDTLSWSRTQALGVVEIGLLTASFSKGGCVAAGTLLLGSILVWLIWCLILRDWECRDQFLTNLLDSVHAPRNIQMTPQPAKKWRRGKVIMPFIVYSLLILNLVLAILFARFGKLQ